MTVASLTIITVVSAICLSLDASMVATVSRCGFSKCWIEGGLRSGVDTSSLQRFSDFSGVSRGYGIYRDYIGII